MYGMQTMRPKKDHVTMTMPILGNLSIVIQMITLDMTHLRTKFEDSSFSRSMKIYEGRHKTRVKLGSD